MIVSQKEGANWLMADPSEGNFMTALSYPSGGRIPAQPLVSEFVMTDGAWHRIGLVWNGFERILYADDIEVAKDEESYLVGATGGLYIGAGRNLDPDSFFSGLVDDVRIYNLPVTP